MNRWCALLYFFVLSIPVFLGIVAWQSIRYDALNESVRLLEADQKKLVENNRKLIADLTGLSSPSRIGQVAVQNLGLVQILPEQVLQVKIEGSYGQ